MGKESHQLCPGNLIPPYTVHFGHTNLKSKSSDHKAKELPEYSKYTNGIKSVDFPLRTVHAQMSVQARWEVLVKTWMCPTKPRSWLKALTLATTGPSGAPEYKIWHARASLGFGRQAYQDSPNNSSLEQGKGSTGRASWRISGEFLTFKRTQDMFTI